MFDTIRDAPWYQLYDFFTAGYPPLVFKLLALNTIFFMYFVLRRLRGAKTMRRNPAIIVQSLLITANGLMMFQKELMHTVDRII